MRKALILIFIISGALSAMADERGELRLERISRHYATSANNSSKRIGAPLSPPKFASEPIAEELSS